MGEKLGKGGEEALIPDVRSQTRFHSTDSEYKLDTSTSVLKWKKHEEKRLRAGGGREGSGAVPLS